jgi:hypothetical protein
MRQPLVLLVAMLAVISGFASGSAPAGGLTLSVGGTYPLHVTFNLLYEVDWSRSSGLEGVAQDDCASWSKDRGTTVVVAHDAPWKRPGEKKPKRHGMPGSLTFYANGQRAPWATWAGGSVVGRATATVHRRWLQKGGPTEADVAGPCKDRYITTPWRPVPTDCGGRTVTTKTATFIPQQRTRLVTLHDLVTGIPRTSGRDVFSVTVSPLREPYRSCKVPDGASAFPVNLGVRVEEANLVGLRNLTPGKTVTGDFKTAGDCDRDLPADVTCTFKVDIDWTIRRWAPGEKFP